jgi:hypothetical protein
MPETHTLIEYVRRRNNSPKTTHTLTHTRTGLQHQTKHLMLLLHMEQYARKAEET